MEIDYKHTWTLSRRSWYVRLYLWVWEASPKEVTFCKLWWGYVMIWIGLPLKLVALAARRTKEGFQALGRRFPDRRQASPVAESEAQVKDQVEKRPRAWITHQRLRPGECLTLTVNGSSGGLCQARDWDFGDGTDPVRSSLLSQCHAYEHPGVYVVSLEVQTCDTNTWWPITSKVRVHSKPPLARRVLTRAEDVGSAVVLSARSIGYAGGRLARPVVSPVTHVVAPPVGRFFRACSWLDEKIGTLWFVVSFVVVWLGLVVLAAVETGAAAATRGTWFPVVSSVGQLAVAVGIGVALACMVGLVVGGCVLLLIRSNFHEFAGRQAKRGALGFRDVMRIGYVAVKSNTCPRVVVGEGEEVPEGAGGAEEARERC